MRIISGIAKGKKINLPIDKKTRPLKDLVKESIFNIIDHSSLLNTKLEKCLVLDLFSGIGSFGLEAISRGVKKVIFYENFKPALNLLNKNINILSFDKKIEIFKDNIYNETSFQKLSYKFDIVFIDPPFRDKNIKTILDNLYNNRVVTNKSLIIIHRYKKTKDFFDNNFKVAREEIYGSSKIIFGFFNF